jgi:hypothetical protein
MERETEGFFDEPVLTDLDADGREIRTLELNDLIREKAFTFLRNPDMPSYEFDTDEETLHLTGTEVGLDDWDEQAWNLLVSQVTIREDGSAEFVFRGEITITVKAK